MADELLAPSPDTSSAPTPVPAIEGTSAPQQATPVAPAQPPATGGAPPGQEGWVPSYRLREAREAAQRQFQGEFAAKEAAIRAEGERYRQQVLALTGVQPPPDPGVQQVRSQFGQLYPGLSRIEERAEEIMGILERAGDLESQNQHYWKSYGQSTMDRVFAKTSEALGGALSDEGKRQLHASFVGFVQSSPELTERYANDPSIVEDFVKTFTSNFIDPVRRAAAATVQGRAAVALPQDTPSGAPRAAGAPQPQNLEERSNAAWALYQQNHRP